jgi:hypothetical protein
LTWLDFSSSFTFLLRFFDFSFFFLAFSFFEAFFLFRFFFRSFSESLEEDDSELSESSESLSEEELAALFRFFFDFSFFIFSMSFFISAFCTSFSASNFFCSAASASAFPIGSPGFLIPLSELPSTKSVFKPSAFRILSRLSFATFARECELRMSSWLSRFVFPDSNSL